MPSTSAPDFRPAHRIVANVVIPAGGAEGVIISNGSRHGGFVLYIKDGRLVYDNSPLALVAVDLARYSGRSVTVDPSAADLRMSGVLSIGDGSKLIGQVQALLPVRADIQGSRIRLVRAP